LLIFNLASRGLADELPQVPALASIPFIPSIVAFGTPKPPDIKEDVKAHMPDFEFWKEKSLSWPVHGKISSFYGPRDNGVITRLHAGVDIPIPIGTPIQAAADGVVTEARVFTGYGITVIIDHENGIKTLYAHCSELAVQGNERVERGQVIAYAGNTGRATTSHVHFGVMVGGEFRDPVPYLKERPRQLANKP